MTLSFHYLILLLLNFYDALYLKLERKRQPQNYLKNFINFNKLNSTNYCVKDTLVHSHIYNYSNSAGQKRNIPKYIPIVHRPALTRKLQPNVELNNDDLADDCSPITVKITNELFS